MCVGGWVLLHLMVAGSQIVFAIWRNRWGKGGLDLRRALKGGVSDVWISLM